MEPTSNPSPPDNAAPGGRPRALDDVKRSEICALISAGCGIEGAARYIGCAPSTIRREALRNPQFNQDLRRASLTAELNPLNAMRNAAGTYWRAAAWLLERTNPQRFGRQSVDAITPAQLQDFASKLGDAIASEIHDEETYGRVLDRVSKLVKRLDRDRWATEGDPYPRARRRKSDRYNPDPSPVDEKQGELHETHANPKP